MKDQLPEESLDKMPPLANHSFNHQDDEIDLKELIVALWQGKFTIIISTVICVALAVCYALSAVEKWTAVAIISQPEVSGFSSYQKMVNDFQPVFDIYQDDGTVLVSEKLDSLVLPENLFLIFVQQFQSQTNKKQFLSTYADFQVELNALPEESDKKKRQESVSVLYDEWYKKLSAVVNKDESYSLKAVQVSSEESYNFLNDYIAYISNKARAIAIKNFKSIALSKHSELTQQQVLFTSQAKSRLQNEFLQTKYALQIAKAAGVNTPQQNLTNNDNELFFINIGANALQAKIDVLSELTELSIIDPRLQQITAKLSLFDQLNADLRIEFDTYQFIKPPEEPLSRTAPKRSLIAVLGVLLGGMLGCGIVLVRFAFREKDTI